MINARNLQDLRSRGYTARGRRKRLERMWSRSWSTARIESTPNGRRHISLAAKRIGEPSAENRHARFDVAGAGNGVGHLTTAPVLDPTGLQRRKLLRSL
jgi:hypothetical protein